MDEESEIMDFDDSKCVKLVCYLNTKTGETYGDQISGLPDVNSLTPYQARVIGEATLKAVKEFIAQPGGEELLAKKAKELKAAGIMKNGELVLN